MHLLFQLVRRPRRLLHTTPPRWIQPHVETHPHLFSHPDELTPGITAQEYHERRTKLMELLPTKTVILKGNSLTYATQNILIG